VPNFRRCLLGTLRFAQPTQAYCLFDISSVAARSGWGADYVVAVAINFDAEAFIPPNLPSPREASFLPRFVRGAIFVDRLAAVFDRAL